MSATLTSAAYTLLRVKKFGRWESLATSVAFSVLIGTAKEVYDREVDPGDIKADFVGSMAAGGLCFTIDLIAF